MGRYRALRACRDCCGFHGSPVDARVLSRSGRATTVTRVIRVPAPTSVPNAPAPRPFILKLLNLLNTDICSYIMKRSNDAVLDKLRTVPVADVCMSVITKAELLDGGRAVFPS